MRSLLLKPVVSEKSLALAEGAGAYVFRVPKAASKTAIAQAVKRQFDVKVAGVRILNVRGKSTQVIVQRGRRRLSGERSNFKKAYVSLASGQSIKLFDEPDKAKTKSKPKLKLKEKS